MAIFVSFTCALQEKLLHFLSLPSCITCMGMVINSAHTLQACGQFFARGSGGVNHLPKKFSQVAQIFTKQSKRNEGRKMQQHRPLMK